MITAHKLRRALAANSAATDFTAKIPTATKPSGSGVFDLFDGDLGLATPGSTIMPKYLKVVPFGTNANDETFDIRVWGWSRSEDDVWIPQLLAELAVTLGNIDAGAIGTDHFLADTIAVSEGSAELTFADIISSADDTAASALLHLQGCELIEFDFDLGTAAGANCYWRVMDED